MGCLTVAYNHQVAAEKNAEKILPATPYSHLLGPASLLSKIH